MSGEEGPGVGRADAAPDDAVGYGGADMEAGRARSCFDRI